MAKSWLDMLAGPTYGSSPRGRTPGFGYAGDQFEPSGGMPPPEPTAQERADSDTRMAAIRDMLGMQNPELYTQPIPRTYSPAFNPEAQGRGWEPEGWNKPRVSEWQPDIQERTADVLGDLYPAVKGGFSAVAEPGGKFGKGYREGQAELKQARQKKKRGTEQYPYGKP